MGNKQIPVTILTGFLGAGKTTLLNRILSEQHGRKLAVIVNEIGAVHIDSQLIVHVEDGVMELTNGCLCCTVHDDFVQSLERLLEAQRTGAFTFDALLIETTGLANPGTVIQTFFAVPAIQAAYSVDGVVAVVDSYHMEQHLQKGDEAAEQLAYADVILLNKSDLVTAQRQQQLTAYMHSINPTAVVYPTVNSELAVDKLLNLQTFRMKDRLAARDLQAAGHLQGITSFVIREERPLDFYKVNELMGAIVQELGDYLYRYKGILSVQETDRRVVFQGVHKMFAASYDRPWREEEQRMSELVFIGQGLNKEWFEQHIQACVAE